MSLSRPSEEEASEHAWGDSRPMAVADPAPAPGAFYVGVGDVVAGKYRVERVLGFGGMAFVLSAKHVHLDEHFALKFLNRELLAQKPIVERFTREAKAACKIRSEHVARVYDVGLHEGAPFIVMEHLSGRDLAAVMADGGALEVADAAEYAMQACVALAVAHSHGIVHRDIKPENLFLVEHEGMAVIKLLDFGISKIALTGSDPRARLTGQLTLGTPCYMSPEQIRSTASAVARSDQWSLGVVLYELLAGSEAFQAETITEVCAAVLEKEPRPLGELRPELPQALVDVVARCMAKNADDRYGDVGELAAALLPFAPSRALVSAERASSILQAARRMESGEHPIFLVRPASKRTPPAVPREHPSSGAPLARSIQPSITEISVPHERERQRDREPKRGWGRVVLVGLVLALVAAGAAYRVRQVMAMEALHSEPVVTAAVAAPPPAPEPALAAVPIATHALPPAQEERPHPVAAAAPAPVARVVAPRAASSTRLVVSIPSAAPAAATASPSPSPSPSPSVELGY